MRKELLSKEVVATCLVLLSRWPDLCQTDWGAAAFLLHLCPELDRPTYFHEEASMTNPYDTSANRRLVSFLYLALDSSSFPHMMTVSRGLSVRQDLFASVQGPA